MKNSEKKTAGQSFAVKAEMPPRLALMIRENRLPHALCIEGRAGTGRGHIAMMAAGAALCSRGDGPMCGECLNCRKVLAGVHPDVMIFDGGDKELYRVENLRSELWRVWLCPNEAPAKAVIMTETQTLSTEAQNVLLRIIEEPPENTYFIMICDNRFRLLPTILSRVTAVQVEPPEPAECERTIRELVPGRTDEEYARATLLSCSCPGTGAALLADSACNDLYQRAYSALEALAAGNRYGAVACQVPYEKDRGQQAGFFRVMSDMLSSRELTGRAGLSEDMVMTVARNLDGLMSLSESNGYGQLIGSLTGELGSAGCFGPR